MTKRRKAYEKLRNIKHNNIPKGDRYMFGDLFMQGNFIKNERKLTKLTKKMYE